jgi:hypothetical protein
MVLFPHHAALAMQIPTARRSLFQFVLRTVLAIRNAHAKMGNAHAKMGYAHAKMGNAHAKMGYAHAKGGCAHVKGMSHPLEWMNPIPILKEQLIHSSSLLK